MKQPQHSQPTTGPDSEISRGPRLCSSVKLAFIIAAIAVTALLAAGCGSSSTPSAAGDGVQATPAQAAAGAQQAATRITELPPTAQTVAPASVSTDSSQSHARTQRQPNERYVLAKITNHRVVQRPFDDTGGNTVNDDNPKSRGSYADSGRPSTRGEPNPCALVSAAQAEAITGKSVKATEAPLGPTCIYQLSGVKDPITLAIERLRFSSIRRHLKGLSRPRVSGQTAYCGKYGSPVTYVPLSGGRVLDISAPCEVGTRFAAAALAALNR